MDFTNFQQVASWVLTHGYWFIFLAMCLEGPITTAAAGFAAALGYFNLGIILLLSVLGDLVPDAIYYLVGYVGRIALIEKMAARLGLNGGRMERIENLLKKHFGKTMVALKLTPVVPAFGFALVGYLKLSFRRFMWLCFLVTLPKTIIFAFFGFFFGSMYNVNQYLHRLEVIIPVFALFVFIFYFTYLKISSKLASSIEKV